MITYTGFRRKYFIPPQVVLRNGKPLSPKASFKLYLHSPDGFNWGYGGSGPAQLALALLFNVTGDRHLTLINYQSFKWAYVAGWGDSWQITDQEILNWLGLTPASQAEQ